MNKLREKAWELRNQVLRVYYSKRIVTKSQRFAKYVCFLPLNIYLVNAIYMANDIDEFTYQKRNSTVHSKLNSYYNHLDDLDDYSHDVLQHDYTQRRFLH